MCLAFNQAKMSYIHEMSFSLLKGAITLCQSQPSEGKLRGRKPLGTGIYPTNLITLVSIQVKALIFVVLFMSYPL